MNPIPSSFPTTLPVPSSATIPPAYQRPVSWQHPHSCVHFLHGQCHINSTGSVFYPLLELYSQFYGSTQPLFKCRFSYEVCDHIV